MVLWVQKDWEALQLPAVVMKILGQNPGVLIRAAAVPEPGKTLDTVTLGDPIAIRNLLQGVSP